MRIVNLLIVLFLVFTGCVNSKISYTWQSPKIPLKQYNKILVVAILKENDSTLSRTMESKLVEEFRRNGYHAESYRMLFGSGKILEEQKIITQWKDSAVDGVFTITLLNKKSDRRFYSKSLMPPPNDLFERRFWGDYRAYFDMINEPYYYMELTDYYWQGNFYEMEYGELLYSIRTDYFQISLGDPMPLRFASTITDDLIQRQIIFK
jgi:hypothetical protein